MTTKFPEEIETRMAAREAEILGPPQRLAPLTDDEFGDDVREWTRANSAAFNNLKDEQPPISDTFRTLFRHFPIFRAQMGVYAQLLANSTIATRDRELIIMRMLWLCNAPQPFGEHVKVARADGMSTEDMIAVLEGPDSPVWTNDHERTILRAVDEIHHDQSMSDETWNKLASVWNDKQMLEFVYCAGQYLASATLHNCLRTRTSEASKGYREI